MTYIERRPQRPLTIVVPTWSVDSEKGGITTFLTGLVGALVKRDDVHTRLLCSPQSSLLFRDMSQATTTDVEIINLPGPVAARPLSEQWVARRIDRGTGDVLLVPSNVGLYAAQIPQIVVVQAPLAVPTIRKDHAHLVRADPLRRTYHTASMGPTLRRAAAVVAVSTWLRGELLRSFKGLDPDRVHVIREGVDAAPPGDSTSMRSPAENRILFVSTLYPYKGAPELIDALGLLAAQHPHLEWTCRLVGLDPRGGSTVEALSRRARCAGVGSRVTFAGFVPHDRVWSEYRAASLFVYPSRLETFGLPPLEAMVSGTPVIASDAPSVREVVGDAALIVDPADPTALSTAIANVLTSRDVRERLTAAGIRRAAELSWIVTADRFATLAAHLRTFDAS